MYIRHEERILLKGNITVSPLDLACLPSSLPLDVLCRALLGCRPSRRRRVFDDHRLVCAGRDRTLWRGETIAQRAVADALASIKTGERPCS